MNIKRRATREVKEMQEKNGAATVALPLIGMPTYIGTDVRIYHFYSGKERSPTKMNFFLQIVGKTTENFIATGSFILKGESASLPVALALCIGPSHKFSHIAAVHQGRKGIPLQTPSAAPSPAEQAPRQKK